MLFKGHEVTIGRTEHSRWHARSWQCTHSVFKCSEVVGGTSQVWFVFGEAGFPPLSKPVCFFQPEVHKQSLLTAHTRSPANALTVFLILSQLDYCNSLLVGVPQMQIKRLQAVQNAAATATVRQTKHDHTTDTLREIHWLAVCDPSLHKLLSITYHSVHKKLPLYFSNLILPYIPSRSLRSAINSFLAVPEPKDCKTKWYGQSTFRYIAPS